MNDHYPATREPVIVVGAGPAGCTAALLLADSGIPVTLAKDAGKPVNAASILGILSLGIGHGEEVTLSADGDGADAALDSLVELLSTDLDKE